MLRLSKGVTLLANLQNEDARRALTVGDLGGKLREGRLACLDMFWGETTIMLARKCEKWQLEQDDEEGPRIRWKNCVMEDMREWGVQPRNAEERLEWRRKTRIGNPD